MTSSDCMPTTSGLRLREQDLVSKVAIVSGASRGIGRATALHLASRGCSILGTCSSAESIHLIDVLAHNVAALYNEGLAANPTASQQTPKVVGIVADIFAADCAKQIADAVEQHFGGRVDIFINSAADPMPGELGNLSVEEIQRSLLGNVQTPVLIVDELVKRKLFRQESRIIYLSSVRTRQPWCDQIMYSAGKSAGESLCRSWSDAFGGKYEKVSFSKARSLF